MIRLSKQLNLYLRIVMLPASRHERENIRGTHEGYFIIDGKSKKVESDIYNKLPCQDITVISEVNGALWFGSSKGAFKQTTDGRYDYYASQRWLPSDNVLDIAKVLQIQFLYLLIKGWPVSFSMKSHLNKKLLF